MVIVQWKGRKMFSKCVHL